MLTCLEYLRGTKTWEQRKLGEIGSVSMCRRIFKEQTSENGEIPFYKIGTFGGEADAFISRELFEEYKAKYQYPKKGDILISASGSIGRTVVFTGKNEYFQDSNIVWLNHDKHLDNSFLKCFYSIVKWAGIEGSTIKRLYNDNILNTAITLPSVEEQQKIGAYFENLDNLITLHQCKCQIDGCRFQSPLAITWEQRKLEDFGKATGGTSIESEFSEDGVYKVISIGSYSENSVYNDQGIRAIKSDKTSNRVLNRNDLTMILNDKTTSGNIIGRVLLIEESGIYVYNQRTERIEINLDEYDPVFLYEMLNAPNIREKIIKQAQGNTQIYVNWTTISLLEYMIPSKEEQVKIGEHLHGISNLIALHQREFAFLCKEKSKKFRYIKNAWEQRKFGEVFDCTVPNNTLSRAELSYDEGTVLNVHYGDVLIKYGSVLDVQKDDIPRIPHRCREDFNGALLQDGDVIIADTAEDETTGKACEIGNLQGSAIVSGLHTMVCRPRNRMALGYLGYYLNSNAYHHQLLPLMQGIKVLSLSRSNIQKTSVSYPSAMKEQQLIASYFSQLDHLITLHQCE